MYKLEAVNSERLKRRMTMKKFAKWLVVVMTVLVVALALSACDSCSGHVHTFDMTKWESDDVEHWHAATCEHTDEKADKAKHTFVDGVCTVCKKEQPHEHTFDMTEWASDSTYHWHAATCGHDTETKDKAQHTFVDGVCTVCKKAESAPHEHTYSEKWTSDGEYHWHEPTCQDTTEVKDKTKHTNETVELSLVTCTTDGVTKTTCTVCGHTHTETVKAAHVITDDSHHARVEATCEHSGNIEYWECDRCNKRYSDKALEHEVTDIVIAKGTHEYEAVAASSVAATCTEYGLKVEKCKHCGDERKTQLAPKGHSWNREKDCTHGRECTVQGCNAAEPALGHVYITTFSQELDCIHDETETKVCSTCGDIYTTTNEHATGHKVTEWELKPYREVFPETTFAADPDMTTCAYVSVGTCKNEHCSDENHRVILCDDNGDTIISYAHEYTVTSVTPATCTTKGSREYTCTHCQDTYTEELPLVADAHTWNGGTTDGDITTYTCDECHATKTAINKKEAMSANVPAADLKTNELELQNAALKFPSDSTTIPENATVSVETVNTEDLEISDELKAQLDGKQVYDFALTKQGTTERVTDLGGDATVRIPYTLQDGEDPDNLYIWYINDVGEVTEIEATYQNGYAVFKTNHFSYYTVTLLTPAERCAKYGHNYKVDTAAPTCVIDGYTRKFCLRCGDKDVSIISATGHKFTTTGKAATCTENGAETNTCSVCNFSYTKVLPALRHDLVTVPEKCVEVSCANAGVAWERCSRCEKDFVTIIAQRQHDFESIVTPATCRSGGYTSKRCKNEACNHFSIVTDYTPATGHSYVVADSKTATCDEDGYNKYKCEHCDDSYTEKLQRTGHTWDIDEPTCGRGQVCVVCKKEGLAATGKHTMVDGVCSVCHTGCEHSFTDTVVKPTCTERGYTLSKCSKCDLETKKDYTQALGHSGDLKCDRCGTALVGDDFFVNYLTSVINSNYTLKLTNLTVTSGDHVQDGYIDELYIGVDEDGELCAYGYGKYFTYEMGRAMEMAVTFVLEKGNIYMAANQNGEVGYSTYGQSFLDKTYTNHAIGSLESFGDMTVGEGEYFGQIDEYYAWLRSDMQVIIDTIIKTNQAALKNGIGSIVGRLYDIERTSGGIMLTLDCDKLEELNTLLGTKPLSEALDEIFGEGTFAKLKNEVKDLLATPGNELAGKLTYYGVDLNKLLAAVGNFATIFTGEEMTASEFLSAMIGQEISIENDILKSSDPILKVVSNLVSGDPDGVTSEQILEMADEYAAMTAYDIISDITGTSKANITAAVSAYIDIIEKCSLSVLLDENGYLKSGSIGVDMIVDDTINVEGSAVILVGNNLVRDYASVKDELEAMYSGLSLDAAHLGSYWHDIGATNVEYYGENGEGSIKSASYTTKRDWIEDISYMRYSGNRYYYEYMQYESAVREIVGNNNFTVIGVHRDIYNENFHFAENPMITTVSDCGTWVKVQIGGDMDGTREFDGFYLKALKSDGTTVTDPDSGEPFEYELRRAHSAGEVNYATMGLEFFYNTATAKMRFIRPGDETETLHKYTEDKSKFVAATGCTGEGKRVYNCAECGSVYTEYFINGHNHEGMIYRVKDGASVTNCEDGYTLELVCPDCNEVVGTREIHGHDRMPFVKIDLTEYGSSSKCGGYFVVYSCACGHEQDRFHVEYKNGSHQEMRETVLREGNWDDRFVLYTCPVTDPMCAFKYSVKTYRKGTCEVRAEVVLGCANDGTAVASSFKGDYHYDWTHDWREVGEPEPDPDRPCSYKVNVRCNDCGATDVRHYTDHKHTHIDRFESFGDDPCYGRAIIVCDDCHETVDEREMYNHQNIVKVNIEATCTQFGITEMCMDCGMIIDFNESVNMPKMHRSMHYDDAKGRYVCDDCGLELLKEVTGNFVLEDFTAKLGGGENYVVGYFDFKQDYYYKDINEFLRYQKEYDYTREYEARVMVVYTRSDGQKDTRMLEMSVESYTEDHDRRAYAHYVKFSKAEARNQAEQVMASLVESGEAQSSDYEIRIAFVPKYDTSNFDYAITFDSENA